MGQTPTTDMEPGKPAELPFAPLGRVSDPHARLWGLFAAEQGTMGVIAIYALGAGLLSLAVPLAVQSLVNFIAFETLLQPVVVLSLVLCGALALMGAFQAIQTWMVELVQQRLFVRAVADLAHRLTLVKRDALDREHGPELVNRFFGVFTLQKGASLLLLDGLAVALQTLIGLVFVAFYHPLLLAFDLLLVAALAFILLVLGRQAVETSIRESKYKFATAAWLEELVRHPGSFRSTESRLYALDRADELAMAYLQARRAHFRILFRKLIGLLTLQAVSSALLLGVGGYLVVQRQLTLGQLVAAELIVANVVAGFVKMAKHLEAYFDMLASVDKLTHLAELPLEREGGAATGRSGPAAVTMRAVTAGPASGPRVFEGLSVEVPAGARVGVVASHGAGKSTLLDLMGGLREPASGGVEIDGLDLRDLDLGELRRLVVVAREDEVVADTVLENLRLGRARIDLAEARRALEAVGLWEAMQDLPEGLSTPLVTGGYPLSPREAGRLAIARAVAGRPRLLLIDEAIDGLDPAHRDEILDTLFDPASPWTLVVVTEDSEVMRRCDRLYRLSGGVLAPIAPPRARS